MICCRLRQGFWYLGNQEVTRIFGTVIGGELISTCWVNWFTQRQRGDWTFGGKFGSLWAIGTEYPPGRSDLLKSFG